MHFHKLIMKSIFAKPYRSLGMFLLAVILSFLMVFGNTVISGMKKGSKNIAERMGADMVLVPAGCEEEYEGILLTTKKNFFYMDASIVEQIRDIKGIEKISPQTFLMTMNASCCDQSAQIVGIDKRSDFTVSPWIDKKYLSSLENGEIIVGSDINIREDKTFRMYGKSYRVSAVLDKSGSSMDETVYISKNEIEELKKIAQKSGQGFVKEVKPSDISVIMIKVAEGVSIGSVIAKLSKIKGVEIITADAVSNRLSSEMNGVHKSYFCIIAAVFLLSFLILYIMQYIATNERKKEMETYRILGIDSRQLKYMFLKESVLLSGTGALAGVLFGILSVSLFAVVIDKTVTLSFLMPSIAEQILIAMLGFLITSFTGVVSLLLNFKRVCTDFVWE